LVTVCLDILPDPILLGRLVATYNRVCRLSFAHANNGLMACMANNRMLLFAYRPLPHTNVNCQNAGGPLSVFFRTNYTPTILGIIISHAGISKQLGTDGYHMSSFTYNIGHIHFPHRLRRSQDIDIILQPTASRGGLTCTEALILLTAEAHLVSLLSYQFVRKLCMEHALVTATTILDPFDGMTCGIDQSPPIPDFR
jgi:hypothetical protein